MVLADFGLTMKRYRKRHKLTQAKLAEMLDVGDKHISFLENGHRYPGPELQMKMELLLMKDEWGAALLAEKTTIAPEDLEIQLRLYQQLKRLSLAKRKVAMDLILYELRMLENL